MRRARCALSTALHSPCWGWRSEQLLLAVGLQSGVCEAGHSLPAAITWLKHSNPCEGAWSLIRVKVQVLAGGG